ncbi:MAG TPA: acetate uptake transporter [Ktedonobacterales bacterium]|nr:acetate uptake transporter [Ktedonobacterales bacterium]
MAGATAGPEASRERERERMTPRQPPAGAPAEYWTRAGLVRGPLAQQDAAALGASAQASIADPVALGLAGFASTRFTISTVYAGWFQFSPANLAVVIPVALIFGGAASFLAGMWAFRRGNALAATTFATFGAFNASWAVLLWMMLVGLVPQVARGGNAGAVDGVFVLTFSLISLYLGLAALGQNPGLAAVLLTMALTHAFLGAWAIVPQATWLRVAGGYCGIVTAALAFLMSAALVINSAYGRELIPLPKAGGLAGR